MSRLGKSINTEDRFVDTRGWEMGGCRVTVKSGISFSGDENILKLDYADGSQLCKYYKNL